MVYRMREEERRVRICQEIGWHTTDPFRCPWLYRVSEDNAES